MSLAPAFVVLAKAPRPGFCKTRLEPRLGPDGCARLQAGLIARAARWAVRHGRERAFVAFTPDDALDEVAALVPEGVRLFAQRGEHLGERIDHAIREGHERGGREGVVFVGTDQPTLGDRHAWAAVDDVRDGVDVSFGPALDGGWYLAALREPHRAPFAIDPSLWGGAEVLGACLDASTRAGLTLGMLRGERDLDEPADAEAFLVDPSTPDDIRALLGA